MAMRKTRVIFTVTLSLAISVHPLHAVLTSYPNLGRNALQKTPTYSSVISYITFLIDQQQTFIDDQPSFYKALKEVAKKTPQTDTEQRDANNLVLRLNKILDVNAPTVIQKMTTTLTGQRNILRESVKQYETQIGKAAADAKAAAGKAAADAKAAAEKAAADAAAAADTEAEDTQGKAAADTEAQDKKKKKIDKAEKKGL
jgi:hypothetical protein